MTLSVVLIVAVALGFDFFNGFHDAANSIATVVSTRVLSPRLAVAWAAFFNFAAFLIFGTKVAATIAEDLVKPGVFTNSVIVAGLIGAIGWDVITWFVGLPTSSSHALVGAMGGAAVASAGWGALIKSGYQKIAVFIVLKLGYEQLHGQLPFTALCRYGRRRRHAGAKHHQQQVDDVEGRDQVEERADRNSEQIRERRVVVQCKRNLRAKRQNLRRQKRQLVIRDDLVPEHPEVPHVHTSIAVWHAEHRIREMQRQRPRKNERDTDVSEERCGFSPHRFGRHWRRY